MRPTLPVPAPTCRRAMARPCLRTARLLLPLLLLLSLASGADALQIRFESRDLPDVVMGEDLRELRLDFDAFGLGAGFGVSVLFSPELYAQLQAPAPPSGWDLLLLQPDPLLPDFGRYDVQALVASPDVSGPFVLSFVWLGSGEPGANPFEVYDPQFQTVETGLTRSAPGPGPALLWMALVPLVAAAAPRRRS